MEVDAVTEEKSTKIKGCVTAPRYRRFPDQFRVKNGGRYLIVEAFMQDHDLNNETVHFTLNVDVKQLGFKKVDDILNRKLFIKGRCAEKKECEESNEVDVLVRLLDGRVIRFDSVKYRAFWVEILFL